MSEKIHFTVVRNQGYTGTEFKTRQRHNERQNENYYNGDIVPERSALNVHYQRYEFPDGTPETYEHTFNRLLDNGEIVKRGLKSDAKVFAELVFDVNTTYFEENEGYDYAVKFFEEAYRMAIKEVGDEKYILSAVMHADERNKDLSEKLGRDIFHYHLHVVYIPVVQKEIYYRKDMKDKEKAGTLKEIIPQISHSKKWPIKTPVERDGKTFTVNSYSLLQDRYYEHMKSAGFDGFERGERGSSAVHLDVLDYKIKQDKKRLEDISLCVEEGQKQVEKLTKATKVRADIAATQAEIDTMSKSAKSGKNVLVSNNDWECVSTMAKRCVLLDAMASDMQAQIDSLRRDRDKWKNNYTKLWNEVKDFIGTIRKIPQRLKAFIAEQLQQKSHKREEIL